MVAESSNRSVNLVEWGISIAIILRVIGSTLFGWLRATHRDGLRERGAPYFWGPHAMCDLFDRLSEKRESMPLLCSAPSKIYLCLRRWFYNCLRSRVGK